MQNAGCKSNLISNYNLWYLISSRVGSSQELDLTQLDISDIGSGQTQSNPTCCCLILQKQDASNFWYPITIFFGILSYNKAKDYFVIREPKLQCIMQGGFIIIFIALMKKISEAWIMKYHLSLSACNLHKSYNNHIRGM